MARITTRRRSRLLIACIAVVTVAIGGFFAVYLLLFAGSSPAPLALSSPAASVPPALTAAQLAGTWKIAGGSVAGYRVREKLAFLPAPSDAVGRTSSITGSMTVSGAAPALTVSSASFSVDVSTLTSDRSMRDQRIHSMGLESDTYSKATFELTAPISLPAGASSGARFTVPATGRLTIHGVTASVTIELQARINGSTIEVQGSLTFPFERFGMTPPSIGGFVSVQDSATLEFSLRFATG